jgi:hypothetical protein
MLCGEFRNALGEKNEIAICYDSQFSYNMFYYFFATGHRTPASNIPSKFSAEK